MMSFICHFAIQFRLCFRFVLDIEIKVSFVFRAWVSVSGFPDKRFSLWTVNMCVSLSKTLLFLFFIFIIYFILLFLFFLLLFIALF